MSLILEALKKSEQQRRLGEAPTLGSPVVATRPRRSLLPVLAILIVVAAAAGWWLTRTPSSPTTPAPVLAPAAAPAATAGAQTPMSAAPSKNLPTPAGSAGNRAPDRPRLTGYATALQKSEQQKAEQEKRAAALANAARGTMPAPPSAPLKPGSQSSASAPAASHATAEKPAAEGKLAAPASTAAPSTASITPPPPNSKADTTTAPTATATATPSKPAAGSALPTVWELPYATRKELPAIELSMHVFAADPKQRFVVIKGERHIEGDEVGQDLVLREIRQDGLVLEYKGQAFFFPRNGR